jgi:hypothetical protein
VTHEPPPEQIYARIRVWQLGGGTTLMHRDGSGVCLTRTPRQVRAVAPERISVTVLGPGRWAYVQGRLEREVESQVPKILLTDQSALPVQPDRRRSDLRVGYRTCRAGVPIEQVRAAARVVEASPIYPLVRNHILQLSAELDAVAPGAVLAMIGNAATELIRALIVSSSGDGDRQYAAMTDSLALRITLYLDEHLRDPELTPSRVAHDHHVSLRQLYNVWSKADDETLGQMDHQSAPGRRQAGPGRPRCGQPHHFRDCPPVRVHRHRPLRAKVPAGVRNVPP